MLEDYKELDVYVTVGDHLGFNIDTSDLFFGTIQPGASGKRSITLELDNCDKCKVNLKSSGSIKDWISISENNFIIKKGEKKSLDIFLNIPNNAQYGNYTGRLMIYFWKDI